MTKIDLWAGAIQDFEGWFPGSRSFRNNNPGNLRYIGLLRTHDDGSGYAHFDTPTEGWDALVHMLTNAATGKSHVYRPNMTLLEFYEKYAPTKDNNEPHRYAEFVAGKLGVTINTPISDLAKATT